MDMNSRKRIFLAHAREDKPDVQRLYSQLKQQGFDPWLDEFDLLPVQVWRDEIPKAIANAAVFLACLSKHSVTKRGYVQQEFRYAISACANLPPNTIYLIPVRLDKCEIPDLKNENLGISFSDLHWVDLYAQYGLYQLNSAIQLALSSTSAHQSYRTHQRSSKIVGRPFATSSQSRESAFLVSFHKHHRSRLIGLAAGAVSVVATIAMSLWFLQSEMPDENDAVDGSSTGITMCEKGGVFRTARQAIRG